MTTIKAEITDYLTSKGMLTDEAGDEMQPTEVQGEDEGQGCICKKPSDNDQGVCMGCGRRIGSRDNR